jgi:hypothetical protein
MKNSHKIDEKRQNHRKNIEKTLININQKHQKHQNQS